MSGQSYGGPGLEGLGDDASLSRRIFAIHDQLRDLVAGIRRISVAIFDAGTGVLRTFIGSTDGQDPLTCYECVMADVPSLAELAGSGEARVIDGLWELAGSPSEHTRRLLAAGYRSSFTVPLYDRDRFLGFVFFDSDEPRAFPEPVRTRLAVYSQLLSLLVAHDRATIHTLRGAVRTALQFSRFRDEETGTHLARVAHYARLSARGLEPDRRPDDEFIEYLFQFAPLHDLGKIAIPDHILLKRGPLDDGEMAIMKTHVTQGADLVDTMVREFDLATVHHIGMLRNLILYHHENYDGSGYLAGLAGEEIPLEARIVKVADTFDALTTARSYKPAWPLDEAFAHLQEHSARLYDPRCVQVMLENRDTVEAIRSQFREPDDAG